MTPDELAERLEAAAKRVGPAVQRGVTHTGTLGIAKIRGNASGRPGPNVITGAYRNSWKSVDRRWVNSALCTIGTELPYGRRLEFGFTGTDSLGRSYAQPPFAHVQPALPFIEQTLKMQMKFAVMEVLQ
ncbi:HK97 gp10 family phage protein (plasmid) [Streptomyces seoulensis]|uniref:HK97 gp10 family phage protein n=1 Tax=Streptomyces seoulensis TaxID=73044 RepID=A0A4P6U5L2_STRSO|nr:HK97 gp10 family phage protein [Streptomyces seoulensis]QBJ94424.1 HK97 gp10 family phage protein [Streptomyces seoulensis]